MAKKIRPHKLVLSFDDLGNLLEAIMQYQIQDGAAIDVRFRTMSVKDSLTGKIEAALTNAKKKVETGEKI